jgi:hypothetical protein
MSVTITIKPWNDPILDVAGHDPRSRYVETFWLPTLGPTGNSNQRSDRQLAARPRSSEESAIR